MGDANGVVGFDSLGEEGFGGLEIGGEILRRKRPELLFIDLGAEEIFDPLGAEVAVLFELLVEQFIVRSLRELKRYKIDSLLEKRYEKIRSIGYSNEMVKKVTKMREVTKIPERLSAKAQLDKAKQPQTPKPMIQKP